MCMHVVCVGVYVCWCVCSYVHLCVCVCVYVCTCIYVCMQVCMHAYTCCEHNLQNGLDLWKTVPIVRSGSLVRVLNARPEKSLKGDGGEQGRWCHEAHPKGGRQCEAPLGWETGICPGEPLLS